MVWPNLLSGRGLIKRLLIGEKDMPLQIKSQAGRLKPSPKLYNGRCVNCEGEVWSKYGKTVRCGDCIREGRTDFWDRGCGDEKE